MNWLYLADMHLQTLSRRIICMRRLHVRLNPRRAPLRAALLRDAVVMLGQRMLGVPHGPAAAVRLPPGG